MNERGDIYSSGPSRGRPWQGSLPRPRATAGFSLAATCRRALARCEKAAGFLNDPAAPLDDLLEERPGTVIGPYKLLEQIGEGGMGLVFMAEQSQPVRRRVALKILKPGMDSRQIVGRFEAERQALALMEHPHIAKVFDAGATESGRPYFVMELVHGVPITEYCDERRLSTRQRLELFVTVCHAVQRTRRGSIHRDLKPPNVLVSHHDTVAVPKVIDFGIAKATGQTLTERTLFTHLAQMLGTPLYMSPEQVEMTGLDVDTRSDVYSLGVLLYELLTGTTPFRKRHRQKSGPGRNALADDPRGRRPPTPSHPLEYAERPGLLDDLRTAGGGRAPAQATAARRAGLDRDEGAGEGPRPAALRVRPAALAADVQRLPGRQVGGCVSAVGRVPVAEVRSAQSSTARAGGDSCRGPGNCHGREHVASSAGQ